MPEFFKADKDGHILTITLNRPERMNACLLYTSDAADE